MPSVEFMGKEFNVDEDGFIDSYDNWCQAVSYTHLRAHET